MHKKLCLKSSLTIAIGTIALVGCEKNSVTANQIQPDKEIPPWNIGEIQQTYKVSSIVDSGPGTLRDAIRLANASPGTDKIIFESDTDLYKKPQTIYLDSPLPKITDNLLIDGYIEDMLWEASGVIIDGGKRERPFNVGEGVATKITNLTIANGFGAHGGGVLNEGQLSITGVTMLGNQASDSGGAIANFGTQLFIINSTLLNNSADRSGGGLFNSSGYAIVTNATFTANKAELGGALFNEGSIQVANTILANSDSTSDCWSDAPFDKPENKNIIENSSGCGLSFSSEDPRLDEPNYFNGPAETIPPGQRSPAINVGNNDKAVDELGKPLVWDQRGSGDPRYVFGYTDIGAFELQSLLHPLLVDTLEDVDLRFCSSAANDCSLRGAILIANNYNKLNEIFFDETIFTDSTELVLNEPLPKIKADLLVQAKGENPARISTRDIRVKTGFVKQDASVNLEIINITVE